MESGQRSLRMRGPMAKSDKLGESEKAPWFEITDTLPQAQRGGEEIEVQLKAAAK